LYQDGSIILTLPL